METKKKALIITYYWPPSGGSGVQRWLKFAKYLPLYGWEPVIYTPENPEANTEDPSLAKDIAPGTEVIKRKIWEPYSIFKMLAGAIMVIRPCVFDVSESRHLEAVTVTLQLSLFPAAVVLMSEFRTTVCEIVATKSHKFV